MTSKMLKVIFMIVPFIVASVLYEVNDDLLIVMYFQKMVLVIIVY